MEFNSQEITGNLKKNNFSIKASHSVLSSTGVNGIEKLYTEYRSVIQEIWL